MLKTSDFTEIKRRIEAAPFQCIRFVNESGEKIISRSNNAKPDLFLDKVEKVLKEFSGTGHFQGKQSIQDKNWINLFSVTSGNGSTPVQPVANLKAEANFNLLQENSRLQSEVKVLEYQNKQLTDQVADLLNQVKDLEETIAEMEEEEPVGTLSEQQNLLMEFAKPLMPGLQAFAFSYLQKFLPQQPQTNELPGEENN
jgi:hypothetical protein